MVGISPLRLLGSYLYEGDMFRHNEAYGRQELTRRTASPEDLYIEDWEPPLACLQELCD